MSQESNEDERINEEYKIWKKNTPFLYDLVLTHALEWPSLSVQFLPEKIMFCSGNENQSFSKQKLILGTHTSGGEQNYLMIAEVRLPLEDSTMDVTQYDHQKQQVGGFQQSNNQAKIEIIHRINHDGEVNRARYCPHKSSLIATKTVLGLIYLFDYTKHESTPQADGTCTPLLKLRGHKREGYGIDWSSKQEGRLASGSDDKLACVWDINAKQTGNTKSSSVTELDPICILEDHGSVVEDVSWHKHHADLLATVCDDKYLRLWDTRVQDSTGKQKPTQKVAAHKAEVNCVDFAPFHEYLLCTGSGDKTVKLWDMRNTKQELHSLEAHTDEVLNIHFSPFNSTVLASSAADRRVMIWDIAKIGMEQTTEDAEDGPPELLFIHGGHTNKVSDFSWNPNKNEEWVISSVAEDNILQIWQVAESIYYQDENEDVPISELE